MATQKQTDKVNKKTTLRDIFDKYQKSREGNFLESTGGGTPIPADEKLANHPEIKPKRVQQPRDEDGQFTYNAVNNIPLKYPSRGVTIPPLLRGIKINFVTKSKTALVIGGLTYVAGIDFSADDLAKALYNFEITPNGKIVFNDLPEAILKRKKGRKSQAEKDMISQGEEGYVEPDHTFTTPRQRRADSPLEAVGVAKGGGSLDRIFTSKPKPPVPPQGGGGGKTNVSQPKTPKIDTSLAKSNPVEFGKKYQKEINNIKKLDPKISESKIINAFASGKVESFDDLEYAINLKNNKK